MHEVRTLKALQTGIEVALSKYLFYGQLGGQKGSFSGGPLVLRGLLLCVIDIFSKYVCVVPLKDKKGLSIFNAFQSILKNSMELHSNRKPNKIWVDKGSEFYNNSFKKWLKDNDIAMYSTHNEGKSVIAERFIIALKNKIYKYMNI